MSGRLGAHRRLTVAVLGAALALVLSSCAFYPYAQRAYSNPSPYTPWWCSATSWEPPDPSGPYAGMAKGDLAEQDCKDLSSSLDLALNTVRANPTVDDATGAGLVAVSAYAAGSGVDYVDPATPIDAVFDAKHPELVGYDGQGGGGQITGIAWLVRSDTPAPPSGHPGGNDWWAEVDALCLGPNDALIEIGGSTQDCADASGTFHSSGYWMLRAWVIRPFLNQPDVFAAQHPCLEPSGPVYDTTAQCFTDSNSLDLQILVTNDDGVAAEGIDAVVEGLRVVAGVEVTVVAPATNQSGTGGNTTPGGVTGSPATTLSGYAAVAVDGFPADAVVHALRVLGENPDLVVSGINQGQNMGPVVNLSGTVGAARRAAGNGIPALAASQENGSPPDWPSGVDAVLDWVEDFRLGRAGPPERDVANLNIPTCTAGSIRGLVEVPTAASLDGRPYGPSDCTSTETVIADDVDGFNNGFITLSDAFDDPTA